MQSLIALLENYIVNDQYWAWWAIAMVMLVFEIILPSAWLIWPAIAAFIVGALAYFMPALDWHIQVFVFLILAFAVTLLGRRYFKFTAPVMSDKPGLNNRMVELTGRKAQVIDDSNDQYNRIRLDDTVWRVRNIDEQVLVKDALVEIIDHHSGVLLVTVI